MRLSVFVYVCADGNVHVSVLMHVCMYACVYVCMYVCMYVFFVINAERTCDDPPAASEA